MTVRAIINPKGILPALSAENLPKNFAQVAENCDPRLGKLMSLKGLAEEEDFGSGSALRSLYKYGSNWLYWTDSDIKVLRAQLAAADERLLYTGDGYPKQTDTNLMPSSGTPSDTSDYRRLGVTPPAAALQVNIEGTGGGTVVDSVSYRYTYVCKWSDGTEEESAPSPVTAGVDVEDGEYISLQNFVVPTLAGSGNDVTHVRIYRVVAGSAEADYQHTKTRPTSAVTAEAWDIAVSYIPTTSSKVYDANDTTDGLTTSLDLETIQCTDWDAPPDDLAGIVQYQNNILAGYSGKNVCVTEPTLHFAWPAKYRVPLDYDIVALGVHNYTLFAMTGSFPYIISGTDPGSLYPQVLPYAQGCLSEKGTVSTPYGVIYPCPDGLFLLNADKPRLITQDVIRKNEWQDLPPDGFTHADLIAFYHDGYYHAFWAGSKKGFMFDLEDPYLINLEPGKTEVTIGGETMTITGEEALMDTGELVYGGCLDPAGDALYLLTLKTNYYAKQWGGGSDVPYTYRSKKFETVPTNFSFGMILGDQSASGKIVFTMYGDGSQVQLNESDWSKQITTKDIFRMPPGKEYRTHEIEMSGSAGWSAVIVATSPEEIESVIKQLEAA